MTPNKEINHSIEPPKKKPKKSKGTSDTVVVKPEKDDDKNKAPNFHSDEDELLAMAWVSATDNPIVGCGQKSVTFWADVHARYSKLQERSTSPETKFPRAWNQLKGRFLRHIQVNINVFNRHYKKAAENIPSGNNTTVDSIMKRAMEAYQQDQGKPFRFSLCVPILYKIPKFDPMTIAIDDNQLVATVATVMGGTLQRPIGSKAAKVIKKEETTTVNNVKSIRVDLNKLVESQIRKEAFNEALALGKYYRMIGDTEKVLENDKTLQELVKAHRTAREVGTVTPSTITTTVPEPVPSVIEVAKEDSSLSSVEVEVLSDVIESEKETVEVEV
jgi:hypothetical protein